MLFGLADVGLTSGLAQQPWTLARWRLSPMKETLWKKNYIHLIHTSPFFNSENHKPLTI